MPDQPQPAARPLRLLLIDDTPADRHLAIRHVEQSIPNVYVTEIATEAQLEEAIRQSDFDLVVTDYQLHWTDGLAILERLRAAMPGCPIIMFTDSGDEEIAVEAMHRGLDDYVPKKPKRHAPLSAAILRALRRREEQATIRALERDRERINEALRVSEKFAELGRMAGVIAHEINNPLESVNNLLYLIAGAPDLSPEVRDYVETCESELGRIAHITRQTLSFYRESSVPEMVDIPQLLDGVVSMFVQRTDQHIDVRRQYAEVQPVLAFPSQVRQVFVNIIVNALEAMGVQGGRLTLRVRRSHSWVRSGVEGLRISIGDTGPGVARSIRKQIFQAFYTTKGERGTGLGLWVSHGIVIRHHGAFHVCSSTDEQHHGTVFSVFLPYRPDFRISSQ